MFPNEKTSPVIQPRYCPGCGIEAPLDLVGSLCPECGEAVIPQGYCPVCEDYWRLTVGAQCPKHEVPLEAPPAALSESIESRQPVTWVSVGVFPNAVEASVPRGRLEAEGIRTFLERERAGSLGVWAYGAPRGGVELQVPADRVAEARVILSQDWSLPSDEKTDFEDLL
jgi:hypothetical protein